MYAEICASQKLCKSYLENAFTYPICTQTEKMYSVIIAYNVIRILLFSVIPSITFQYVNERKKTTTQQCFQRVLSKQMISVKLFLLYMSWTWNFVRLNVIEADICLSQKFWKKWNSIATCWEISTETCQASDYDRVVLNVKFNETMCIRSLLTLATQFLYQTDIFQKYSNRVQDKPKRVNPSKIRSLKNFTKKKLFLFA